MQLPFGEWLPDQPDHLNPGATVATNVYHAQSSYKPVKGLVAYSGTSNVTQNAKGAGSFRDNTNTVFTFVGTKDNIYKLTSGTFASVKGSLTISGGDTDFFTFTQFGQYIIFDEWLYNGGIYQLYITFRRRYIFMDGQRMGI